MDNNDNIIIYTTEDGFTKVDVTYENETVWLSVAQMAELFQRDRSVISKHIRKVFELDDNSLKEAGGGGYFKELLERIRDIRASEKVFYRQVLEIYSTSIDYDPKSDISIEFFKKVQNKIHYAVHGETAAEVIYNRVDAEKEFMGVMSFEGTQPTLKEAKIASRKRFS